VKGELDERDMKVFFNIQLVGFRSWEGGEGGLQLAISFQTTKPVRKWETFSSLMFGNLVCLSPRGRFHQVWKSCDRQYGGIKIADFGPMAVIVYSTGFQLPDRYQ
jgi:hypothetical protein